jgi:hypothetical protein
LKRPYPASWCLYWLAVKVVAQFVFSLVQSVSLFFAQLSASAVDMEI